MFEGGVRVPCVVSWPGVIEPSSHSDTLLQSEDFYPTLLEALNIQPSEDQVFDGQTVLAVLRGKDFQHEPIFQYFPHSPPVPDWLPPSVSVHRGDWKLIRIFHGGEKQAHLYLLFNLRDDISETKNLADAKPELVQELDALIEAFLDRTHAVRPTPNPAFDPAQYQPEEIGKPKVGRKPPPQQADKGRSDPGALPELKGWKARGCDARVTDGIATIQGKSDATFLGLAPGVLVPGAKVGVRWRRGSGDGWLEWLPKWNVQAAKKSSTFEGGSDQWSQLEMPIPLQSREAGILRLYLPATKEFLEIDWIEIVEGDSRKRWEF